MDSSNTILNTVSRMVDLQAQYPSKTTDKLFWTLSTQSPKPKPVVIFVVELLKFVMVDAAWIEVLLVT